MLGASGMVMGLAGAVLALELTVAARLPATSKVCQRGDIGLCDSSSIARSRKAGSR